MGRAPSTTVNQPAPPAAPTTGESISDWLKYSPDVFAEQQRQAPLQAQQQVDLATQYAPQLGAAAKAGQEALYPETTALQEQLAGQASEGMTGEMPAWMQEQQRDTFAANLGSNVGSGIGADYQSTGMLQAQQGYQNYYRNLGLSLAGRQPLAQPTMPQTGQPSQQFTPQAVMGNAQQGYNSFAGLYGSMYGSNAQLQASRPGGVNLGFLGRWGG